MTTPTPKKIITDPREFEKFGVRIQTRYEPRLDNVLISRFEETVETTEGGIIIPDSHRARSNKGKVVAVGPGRYVGDKLIPTGLESGDIVLFSKYGGDEIELDGEPFLLVRADEVKLREKAIVS